MPLVAPPSPGPLGEPLEPLPIVPEPGEVGLPDTPVPDEAPVDPVPELPLEVAGPQSAPALRLLPDDALFCTLRVAIAASVAAEPVAAGGGQSTVAPELVLLPAPDAPLVEAPAPEPAPGTTCGAIGLSVPYARDVSPAPPAPGGGADWADADPAAPSASSTAMEEIAFMITP